MYGSFNEEVQEVWDFVRCQRSDGTFYGTAGTCRKGNETGAREKAPAKAKSKAKKKPEKKALSTKAKAALKAATPEQLEKLKKSPKVTPKQKKVLDKAIAEKKKSTEKPRAELSQADYDKQLKSLGAEKQKALDDYLRLDTERQKAWSLPDSDPRKADAEAAFKKAGERLTRAGEAVKALEAKNPAGAKKDVDVVARDEERNRRGKDYRAAQDTANLNTKQKAAIRDYTDEGGERPYSDLNACLRQPKTCDPSNVGWTKQHAKELDSALKALPKNEAGEPFWRGTKASSGQALALYQALEKAQPGTKITDPAFGSYSYDEAVAKGYTSARTKSILFVSRNKELRPVDQFSEIPLEREAMLPRRTQQTVRSVKKDGEMLIVELD